MIYIKLLLDREYFDFCKYHNNKYNLIVHVLCGSIYISCLNLFFDSYLIPVYLLLLLSTISFNTTLLTISLIQLFSFTLYFLELQKYQLLLIYFFNCFIVPEISHIITNEQIVLNYNNFSILKLIINIIFFLPFSINRLHHIIFIHN